MPKRDLFLAVITCNLSLFCCCAILLLGANPFVFQTENASGIPWNLLFYAGLVPVFLVYGFSSRASGFLKRHEVEIAFLGTLLPIPMLVVLYMADILPWQIQAALAIASGFCAGIGLGLCIIVRIRFFVHAVSEYYGSKRLAVPLVGFVVLPAAIALLVAVFSASFCYFAALVFNFASLYVHWISKSNEEGVRVDLPRASEDKRWGTSLALGVLYGIVSSLVFQNTNASFVPLPIALLLFAIIAALLVKLARNINAISIIGKTMYFVCFALLAGALFAPRLLLVVLLLLVLTVFVFRVAEYILVVSIAAHKSDSSAEEATGESQAKMKSQNLSFLFLGLFLGQAVVEAVLRLQMAGQVNHVCLALCLVILFGGIFYTHFLLDSRYDWMALMGNHSAINDDGASCGDKAARPETLLPEIAFDEAFIKQHFDLSSRQVEVLILLARGHNADGVARRLHVSKNTARTHIYNIYGKIGVSTHQELIDYIESTVRSAQRP